MGACHTLTPVARDRAGRAAAFRAPWAWLRRCSGHRQLGACGIISWPLLGPRPPLLLAINRRDFRRCSQATMTTYIPSLTLPRFVFEQPAVSIFLPMVAGAAIGYSTRRTSSSVHESSPCHTHPAIADQTQKTYRAIKQPPLHPPAYVFGPVWTALYATMGYTAWRAWTTGTASFNPETVSLAKQGATLYTIQLGLNLAWMPLFFGLYRPIAATADIVALGGVTSYLTYVWGKVDPTCGWLLAPYLGWLGFATYLCVS